MLKLYTGRRLEMKGEKNKIIFIIAIIFGLILMIVTIFLIYNYSSNKTPSIASIKLEKDKEYVYTADYVYKNKYNEFSIPQEGNSNEEATINNGIKVNYTSGTWYLSNLKVPYINIKSEDAYIINSSLKKLYLNYAKKFDNCASESSCSLILTYKTYIYDNILSVIVIDSTKENDPWLLNYQTYNFNLDTGSLLGYNSVLAKLGYSKIDTLSTIKNKIKGYLDSTYNNLDLNNCKDEDDKNDTCYNISNKLLEDSINNNSLLYFVNNNGNINVIVIPYAYGIPNALDNYYSFEITK